VRIAAPDHQRQVLEDQREPHRRQHLAELLPAQALQERVPLRDADERDGEGAQHDGKEEAPGGPDDRQGDVATQ
jgi:hypothetical protein